MVITVTLKCGCTKEVHCAGIRSARRTRKWLETMCCRECQGISGQEKKEN